MPPLSLHLLPHFMMPQIAHWPPFTRCLCNIFHSLTLTKVHLFLFVYHVSLLQQGGLNEYSYIEKIVFLRQKVQLTALENACAYSLS